MTDVVSGQTIVVAVFTTLDLIGVIVSNGTSYDVPTACAVGVVQASEPGKLVLVTRTGAAAPTTAAPAYL